MRQCKFILWEGEVPGDRVRKFNWPEKKERGTHLTGGVWVKVYRQKIFNIK